MNIEYLKELSDKHSELHLYVEEHDVVTGGEEHIGLRSSQAEFRFDDNIVVFNDGVKNYHLDAENIILAEPAIEFPD